MTLTATFVPLTSQESTENNAPAIGTLIWNQPAIQFFWMKFLCLFFQNFQTLVKMSHLAWKNLKMMSCLIVAMLLHDHFPRKN